MARKPGQAVLLDIDVPYTTQSRHYCCEHKPACHYYAGCRHCPCVVAWGGEGPGDCD